jgi:hypothetical protein
MAYPGEVEAFLEVVRAFPAEVVGGKTCLSLRVTTKSGQFVAKLGRVFSLIATAIQAAVEMFPTAATIPHTLSSFELETQAGTEVYPT